MSHHVPLPNHWPALVIHSKLTKGSLPEANACPIKHTCTKFYWPISREPFATAGTRVDRLVRAIKRRLFDDDLDAIELEARENDECMPS